MFAIRLQEYLRSVTCWAQAWDYAKACALALVKNTTQFNYMMR